MIVLVDTRQKDGKHNEKHLQIKSLGYQLKHCALSIGDYMLEGQGSVSVDTKQDLQEVYSNVVNDKSRFMKEVRRAFFNNVKLYVLVEHGNNIKSLKDVYKWTPKYGHVSGRELMERLNHIHMAYGTEFVFCDKSNTGKWIIKLLTT